MERNSSLLDILQMYLFDTDIKHDLFNANPVYNICCGHNYLLYLNEHFSYFINNEKRREIISCIDEHPGRHFNELKRHLDVSQSTLTHHILKLEKAKLIYSISDGYYTRYYLVGAENNHEALSPIQEKIVELLKEHTEITYQDLMERMDKSNSTLSYHMKILGEKDIVKKKTRNKKHFFYLSNSADVHQ